MIKTTPQGMDSYSFRGAFHESSHDSQSKNHHINITSVCDEDFMQKVHHTHDDRNWLTANLLLSSKYSAVSAFDCMAKLKVHFLHLLFHRRSRVKKWSFKTLVFVICSVIIYLQLSTGIFQRSFLEKEFRGRFQYPQEIDNFQEIVQQCIDTKRLPGQLDASSINLNYSNIPFIKTADAISKRSPDHPIGLLVIVKSATYNHKKRMAIRKTWGDEQYLKENGISPGLSTKVAFICGIQKTENNSSESELFHKETQFGDIVLAQFHDAYENNTYKTILAMRWAVEYVKDFKYLMIVDDDMYINLVNAVSYLKSISDTMVQELISENSGVKFFRPVSQYEDECVSIRNNVSLGSQPLIMGHLIVDAKPFRSFLGFGSKWSMSMNDYPFNYFPPYIAGGITLFDQKTVARIYYGSLFTRHFWVDDVYIGIIAHKLGIKLTSNNLMDSSYSASYDDNMKGKFPRMIGMHGLQCPEQLIDLWHAQDLESLKDCMYLKGLL